MKDQLLVIALACLLMALVLFLAGCTSPVKSMARPSTSSRPITPHHEPRPPA